MKKKVNSIDLLIENLQKEFSKIPNFELTQNIPLGKKLFDFVVRFVSEFQSYQDLFVQFYLPASLKSIQTFKRELKFSKYKQFFNLTEDEYKENSFETVRLGYVGAFHKYESFLKNLIPMMDEFFKEIDFNNKFLPITEYLKSEFDVELKKITHNFPITRKINWICNCVKHYDGYPIKEPILKYLDNFDKNKKIQIDSKEFKKDMQELIKHNQNMLTLLFYVGLHQYFGFEFSTIENELKPEHREKDKVEKMREVLRMSIKALFNLGKYVT